MTQLAPAEPDSPQQTAPKQRPATDQLETFVFDVEGMMCAGCVSAVEKKISGSQGVTAATVNLITEVAAVTCVAQTDPEAIAQRLTDAGYPSRLRQAQDGSPGNSALANETAWIERQKQAQQDQSSQLAIALTLLLLSTLGHLQHFSWSKGLAIPVISPFVLNTLWFHGTLATLTLIFPARKILIEGAQGIRRGTPNMNTLVSLGALSAYITSLVALLFPALGWECFFDEPVMLLSFILLGRTLENRARFKAASSLRSLIALQPTLARLVPEPDNSAASSIASSIASSPGNSADYSTGSSTDAGVQIPANQVQVGEWLRVLPSEKIPVDGVIVTGQTTADEAMLTGESLPVVKKPGDTVTAGSLNQSGAITLQVTRIGADTTLAQMVQLVETAQTRKAPIQGLADLISGYFTYGVLACSALTFAFWYFVGVPLWPEIASGVMVHAHHGAEHADMMMPSEIVNQLAAKTAVEMIATPAVRILVSLKLAIAVIVVACPCALGLATPTAILVGSGIGAQQGLLIRGGDILEATHALDTLVFDKTGTLTTGNPTVTDVLSLSEGQPPNDLLQIAATVESGTRHPLGQAIQQAAIAKSLTALPAKNFQTEAGFGAMATVTLSAAPSSTHNFFVGNWAWMEQNQCTIPNRQGALDTSTQSLKTRAEALGDIGKTVVFIAKEQQIIGLIGIADTLRAEAKETVEQLQQLGLNVQILSGDTLSAATAIAKQLGLAPEQVQANVPPEGKVSALEHIKSNGHRVGFVGDGINDAPALATADVGIALNSGTEVAMETADIVLMGDTLSDVLAAIKLSQATFNKIRQNLTWAFAYNLICIPLAAGAFLPAFGLALNPGLAGGLMALSSLTVALNSLHLKTLKL